MLSIEEDPGILIVPKDDTPIYMTRTRLISFGLTPIDPEEGIYERLIEVWQNNGLVFFRRKDGKVLVISGKGTIVTTIERIEETNKAIKEAKEKVLKFLEEAT